MRKYLATLHQKPDHHKKRFAFLASGIFTLTMFVFWSLATFGDGGTLAQNNIKIERAHEELGPFESLRAGLGSGLAGFFEALSGFGNTVRESVDLESGYTEMKDDVLNIYGQ